MPVPACIVGFTGPTGIHHSVEVMAETLFEAAGMGLAILREAEWIDAIALGTKIEVRVKAPETIHSVTLMQLQRWCEAAGTPDEIIRKQRTKQLLEPSDTSSDPVT